jgi:hypothetical protein
MKFMNVMWMSVRMTVWVSVMIMSTFIRMEDFHDVEVATKAEKWGEEHVKRLLDDLSFDDAVSGLNEEFNGDAPNDGDID